ncbi:MAG: cytochrome P450 [Acidimicrobiales bacterium]
MMRASLDEVAGGPTAVTTDDRVTEEVEFDPFALQDTVTGDIRDPYPKMAELRRQSAVHLGAIDFTGDSVTVATSPEVGECSSVSVFGHDEVVAALRDDQTYSSTVYEGIMGIVMGRTILQMDAPHHRVQRALVSPAFRSRILERWETALVGSVVDDLIDKFAGRGRADLVRELTFGFPVQVIARILGLPMYDYPKFQRWTVELISVAADWERGMAASHALGTYLTDVIAQRRAEPADDLISELAVAEIEGQQLSDEEILAFLRLLLPAGVETTYRATGNLLFGLLQDPVQLDALRRDRTLFPRAFEESLRWEPPVTLILRRTMKDTVLGGVRIPAGTDVGLFLGAANRDERRYDDPDRFDIFREAQQHVGFGFGVHMCMGMHLARMESRVAVNAILDRLADIRLDPAPGDDPHIHGLAFRSPTSLPVSFTAC